MKKLMLWMIALALHAQNITGTWQGVLKVGAQEGRVVFKISLGDDKLQAAVYSIDRGGQAISSSAFTKDGSVVKVTFATVNGSFDGRVSADGNSIAGTWTQGPPLPLTLLRATPAARRCGAFTS